MDEFTTEQVGNAFPSAPKYVAYSSLQGIKEKAAKLLGVLLNLDLFLRPPEWTH